jgi:RNA polymerase sigma factor (sigma-70 family)
MDENSGRVCRENLVVPAQRGDAAARDDLVKAYMPLVGAVARNYRHQRAVERAELMQEGVVGLLRALERYDASLGTPFWAYASWWVRQAMQKLVAELSGPVVLSDRALRQLARVRESRRAFIAARGREPSVAELAARAGMTTDHVRSLAGAQRPSRGLGEPVGENSGATYEDFLADPRAEDAYDDAVGRIGVEQVPALMACLDDRERLVVQARYGVGEAPRTLRELSAVLGLSAERVRQIEQCALARMRDRALSAAGPAPAEAALA